MRTNSGDDGVLPAVVVERFRLSTPTLTIVSLVLLFCF